MTLKFANLSQTDSYVFESNSLTLSFKHSWFIADSDQRRRNFWLWSKLWITICCSRVTCTLFRVLARNHRRWRGHGAFVRPLGTETRAQCLYGIGSASVRLGQSFLRPVQLLHECLAVQVRVSQICKHRFIDQCSGNLICNWSYTNWNHLINFSFSFAFLFFTSTI